MWNTRKQSLKALNTTLKEEADLIYEGFEIIDKVSQKLSCTSNISGYSRVCGLVLIKGRNLCQGIFSLALEGLAQESGALLRPTIECIELLEYFYQDPKRIKKAVNDELPSAGKIAKEIKGIHKELRKYLNSYASHLSIGMESMAHLVNWNEGTLRIKQIYSEKVLKKNLLMLFCFMIFLSNSTVKCIDKNDPSSEILFNQVYNWQKNGKKITDINFAETK